MRSTAPLISAFLSGISCLALQYVWLRRLAVVMGSTTLALSVVLASFMVGIALGSWRFGRSAADHDTGLARRYCVVEVMIALAGITVVYGLDLFAFLYAPGREPLVLYQILRAACAGLVLTVPTFFMGGTLPLLASMLRTTSDDQPTFPLLYAVNTAGAALGLGLVTFLTIPQWGLRVTEWLAVAANLVAGVLVFSTQAEFAVAEFEPIRREPPSRIATTFLIATGLSGFAAFVGEVVWSRLMALVAGGSIYAQVVTLIVFLTGSALGAVMLLNAKPNGASARRWFVIAQGLGVFGALALTLGMPQVIRLSAELIAATTGQQGAWLTNLSALGVVLVFLPALGAGLAFPAIVLAAGGAETRTGPTVGGLAAANTVGAVIGALAGGIVCVPLLGLGKSLIVLGVACGGAATLVAYGLGKTWRWVTSGAVAVAAIVMIVTPCWSEELMISSPGFLIAQQGSHDLWQQTLAASKVLFYRDGREVTASVDQIGGHRYYRTNGKTDASNFPRDRLNQELIGHVPALLHPHPEQVFVLGLGTGITAAAVATHPIKRLDIVDIEGAAWDAAQFFGEENHDILADDRVSFTVADGRHVLQAGTTAYDLILVDGSDLWTAGSAHLFTHEFYQLAKGRLKTGGLFAQWFHMHGLSPESIATIVRTAQSAFPVVSLWRLTLDDLLVIGQQSDERLDWQLVAAKWQSPLLPRLEAIGLPVPTSLLATFLMDGTTLESFAADATVQTDDRPWIEFVAPRTLFDMPTEVLAARLEHAATQAFPETMRNAPVMADLTSNDLVTLGSAYGARERFERALTLLRELIDQEPTNAAALTILGQIYVTTGEQARGNEILTRAMQIDNGGRDEAPP